MISRRALFAALADRHFGNGSPTWRIGRGSHGSVPARPSRTLTSQREQLITKLDWLGKHHKLPVAQQLARKLRRCGGTQALQERRVPSCVRALQRLCVEVGLEIDRSERQLP